MKRLIVLLLLIAGIQHGRAQSHQWANTLYSRIGLSTAFSITNDKSYNTYLVGKFYDSLYIDNKVISVGITPGSPDAYFAKLNPNGKLNWCKILYTNRYNVVLRHVQIINDNKVLIYGFFDGDRLKFTKNDSLTKSGASGIYTGFVAQYDSSGNFINATKTYIGYLYGSIWQSDDNFNNGEFTRDKKGYCYLKFFKNKYPGQITYSSGSISLNDSIPKDIFFRIAVR